MTADIIEIVARVEDKASQPLERIEKKTKKLQRAMSDAMDNGQGAAKQFEERIKKTSRAIEDQQKALRGLQREILAISLSILFVGLAVRRFTDKAFRGMLDTMSQVTGDTHEFNVLTNRLRANWEFMKFTLMDALMQSGLFQTFIGFLIRGANAVSNLSDRQREIIVVTLAIAAAVGTLMIVFGQFGTLAAGLLLKTISMSKWLIAGFIKLKAAFALGFGAGIKVILLFLAKFVLIPLAIAAVVAGIWWLFSNWDEVWTSLKMVFFGVISLIMKGFDWFVNKVIDRLNFLIGFMNKMPGVDIGTVGASTRFGSAADNLDRRVWDLAVERQGMQEGSSESKVETNNYDIDYNVDAAGQETDLKSLLEGLEEEKTRWEGSAV